MGNTLPNLWPSSGAKKEYRIIIWGLWYSGKTTILYNRLMGMDDVTPVSTIGFNIETITHKDKNFLIFDLGGRDKLRPQWREYFSKPDALIYVVDATETNRLKDAAYELKCLLEFTGLYDKSSSTPVLVFANKNDLEGTKPAGEILEALQPKALQHQRWKVVPCSALRAYGIDEGMDWLAVSYLLLRRLNKAN
ncbi:ADP-ribosylation factor family protein [Aspergillus lucknowensis]|uniref:ADP-ribosylation factor family-domain-containing protein n=1 Tax=Aspergillus lucknowensis TaxID=176173 RepID=A0ABR4LPQ6_9EURO